MSEIYLGHEISAFTLREFIVLGTLKEQEMCGSEVIKSLSEIGDVGTSLGIGIVYPLLKNLVRDGALCARRTGGGRRAFITV